MALHLSNKGPAAASTLAASALAASALAASTLAAVAPLPHAATKHANRIDQGIVFDIGFRMWHAPTSPIILATMLRDFTRLTAFLVLTSACGSRSAPPPLAREAVADDNAERESAGPPDYEDTLLAVASDIEDLKSTFPQLADFSSGEHFREEELAISYGYRTHRAETPGGWVAAVPNPDADGVWFHIDFHAADSTAQIHTQPVTPPLFFWDKKVMFLILEGDETKKVAGALHEILLRHGVTTRPHK